MIYLLIYFGAILSITIVLALVAFSNIVGLWRSGGVPFVPLNHTKMMFLQEEVRLGPTDRLVDLGCGDGRVLRLFERQGVKKLVGYEVNFWAFLQARLVGWLKHSEAKIFLKNFQHVNLSRFNIVFCYLLPKALLILRQKFDQELLLGTKVITYDFPIADWRQPKQILTNRKSKVYIYEI